MSHNKSQNIPSLPLVPLKHKENHVEFIRSCAIMLWLIRDKVKLRHPRGAQRDDPDTLSLTMWQIFLLRNCTASAVCDKMDNRGYCF